MAISLINRSTTILQVGAMFLLVWLPAISQSQVASSSFSACGSLDNGYGPYDYRNDRPKLPIVEGAHFTPEVEMLLRAKTGIIGADIDYTLRAFPNHHRALLAMARLAAREKTTQPTGARYTVDCYFDRAIRFASGDTVARSLYADYLAKAGRVPEATLQLDYAAKLAGDNGFTQYNIGLVFLEMKAYERALTQAHRAIELGFPRQGLADALKQAGAWREPVPVANAEGASAPTKP